MQMTTLGALTKAIREEGKVMWQDFYSLSAPFHLEEMNDKQSKGLGCREGGGGKDVGNFNHLLKSKYPA